jgi:Rrf2 family protein
MIYSAGCEYAIRAVTKLAEQWPAGTFCLLRDILDGEKLPQHFVGKVFQTLTRADILVSAKGRGGGFALRRPPAEITLREIVEAVDGRSRIDRCILGLSSCDSNQPCPQHDQWAVIRQKINEVLDKTTVADLVKALAAKQTRSSRTGASRRR